jgi:hypothetical protein
MAELKGTYIFKILMDTGMPDYRKKFLKSSGLISDPKLLPCGSSLTFLQALVVLYLPLPQASQKLSSVGDLGFSLSPSTQGWDPEFKKTDQTLPMFFFNHKVNRASLP